MQMITLDLCIHDPDRAMPVIWAKQGDVGRKFQVRLTKAGVEYPIPSGTSVCLHYFGPSGMGNYTSIGEESAFSVAGNVITVELITQMLQNQGGGKLTLTLNDPGDDMIGTWDLLYKVQDTVGAGSPEAVQYYTAFSEAADKALAASAAAQDAAQTAQEAAATFATDTLLTQSGVAADAKATGDYLKTRAAKTEALQQAELTYDSESITLKTRTVAGNAAANVYVPLANYYAPASHSSDKGNPHQVTAAQISAAPGTESAQHPGCYYRMVSGITEWINPPMVTDTEYRTTARWNGKPVYIHAFSLGGMPNNDTKVFATNLYNIANVLEWGGTQSDGLVIPHWFGQLNTGVDGVVYYNGAENNRMYIRITTTGDFSANTAVVWAKYTKTTD